MYDELIKNLRHDSASALQNCDFDFVHGWMLEAADAIEELQRSKCPHYIRNVHDRGDDSLCDKWMCEVASLPKWIPVTEMNCASCKYAIFNMFVEPCCNCNEGSEFKPKTNADRIRSMTDEELAELLEGCICPKSHCPDIDRDTPTDKMRCTKCWLEWLKQESDGE